MTINLTREDDGRWWAWVDGKVTLLGSYSTPWVAIWALFFLDAVADAQRSA